MFYYILALFVLGLDQVTKWMIVKNMHFGESITVIENVFYITSHRNRGAAFGILQNQMWFFIIITIAVIFAVIYYMQKHAKHQPLLRLALGLVLGGATGNFLDRIIRKEVVDFLDVKIGSYNYPIFNVADSALVIGVILIFIQTLMESKSKKENMNGAHRS
ncbi:signal peptidase II [Fictibacillus enclensis]|uniref:Lipoprotein signal peptidase n=1 Tax=Fictibacillus enclensis TaxID=1017270 RepID=A0A0V8JDA8_9BACL|nr:MULTISPECIES: signal peptidase II [Fictibacillus]KSU85003.1 signal peptidase II [Fictibacillus enclensis]MDM5337999.1 signal peptidase II [Fictibacillus enclensis]RXY99338.1 lipoprotein signal peptidase [Fictibacillus sp. S7]WHY74353.1 signal peptidase II [Fictibacillus enclensis]SCB89308.1 signal peptidase II . Aspartic peptidase. MEROPS family A08 [Fictibacillus enclensis]